MAIPTGSNAGKYGALKQADGLLDIRWALSGAQDYRWLRIDWVESGVAMPESAWTKRTGQGRELIERGLPYQLRARTSFALNSDGVHCSIEIPASPLGAQRDGEGAR